MNGEVATLAADQPETGRPDVTQRFRFSVPGVRRLETAMWSRLLATRFGTSRTVATG